MPVLETVDLEGVEILSAGGPVRGIGSPPQGDYFTAEQIRQIADSNRELADEIKPPAKIGHGAAGNAVGWLDNIRATDDGGKLLADIQGVPRRFADLVKARAYRTRSAELSRKTSQRTGKTHDWVVTGLAWLGDKLPAVQTLDDVVALYEGDAEVERRFVAEFENPDPPASERLLEAVVGLAQELAGKIGTAADSRATMPEKTYTVEQRRKFADATGLDADKVTDEMLANAGVTNETEAPPPDDDGGDQARALQEAVEKATQSDERSRKLEEDLRLERRERFVESVLGAGKAEPGQRTEVESFYDKDPDAARKFFEAVKPSDELARAYGSDEDGSESTEEQEQAAETEYQRSFEAMYGEKAAV